MAVETAHGVLRGLLLVPLVGDFAARQIGVLTGSVLIFCVAYWRFPALGTSRAADLLRIGLLWALLTLAFELALGLGVAKMSWGRIWEDYDIVHGGLMPFGLCFLALSPLLAGWSRRSRASAATGASIAKGGRD